MKSAGARFANELQWLEFKLEHQYIRDDETEEIINSTEGMFS